jgi:hypothetical protein
MIIADIPRIINGDAEMKRLLLESLYVVNWIFCEFGILLTVYHYVSQ